LVDFCVLVEPMIVLTIELSRLNGHEIFICINCVQVHLEERKKKTEDDPSELANLNILQKVRFCGESYFY
jgi:hypothetical protein